MTDLFALIIECLTDERHLALLKIGGMLCAAGDIAAVFCLLLAVGEASGRRPTKRMAILAVCLAASAAQLAPDDVDVFFTVMFAVFAVPYLILVYTAVTGAPVIVARLKEIIARRRGEGGAGS